MKMRNDRVEESRRARGFISSGDNESFRARSRRKIRAARERKIQTRARAPPRGLRNGSCFSSLFSPRARAQFKRDTRETTARIVACTARGSRRAVADSSFLAAGFSYCLFPADFIYRATDSTRDGRINRPCPDATRAENGGNKISGRRGFRASENITVEIKRALYSGEDGISLFIFTDPEIKVKHLCTVRRNVSAAVPRSSRGGRVGESGSAE